MIQNLNRAYKPCSTVTIWFEERGAKSERVKGTTGRSCSKNARLVNTFTAEKSTLASGLALARINDAIGSQSVNCGLYAKPVFFKETIQVGIETIETTFCC